MNKDNLLNEIPKYKKKKQSKKVKRANHKHVYVNGLAKVDNNYSRIEYCNICGRINKMNILETEENSETKFARLLTNEEIYEKYKHLNQFNLNSYHDKYVTIVE